MFSCKHDIFTQFKNKIDEGETHMIYMYDDKSYDIYFEAGVISITSGIISIMFYGKTVMYSMTMNPDEQTYLNMLLEKSEVETPTECYQEHITEKHSSKLIELQRKIRKDKIKMLDL